MLYNYILSIKTLGTLHALQRIVFIFKRNKIRMEQMNIFEIKESGISHFSVALQSEQFVIEKCLKQLRRVFEILEVKISSEVLL